MEGKVMKNWTITRALVAEKKILVLALGALLAVNMSAREVKRVNHKDFRFRGGDKILVMEPAHRVRGKEIVMVKIRKGDFRDAKFRRGDFRRDDLRRGDFRKAKFRKAPKRVVRR